MVICLIHHGGKFKTNRYHFSPDGDFGDKSHKASIKFQKQNGLVANGFVDNSTYLKAMQFGFQLIDELKENVDENTSGWPAPPTYCKQSWFLLGRTFSEKGWDAF